MGLFGDAFNISAGATLGNLAVKTGYQAAEEFLNATEKGAYNKLRSESFDPVVRQDLNDILVRGMLQTISYPFPQDEVKKKENFFMKHKLFFISILVIFLVIYYGDVLEDFVSGSTYVICLVWAIYVGVVSKKKMERGKKKLMESGFRPKLIKDGKQYWHMREYVRQALAMGQMSVQDAIVKISNTELGRQFPDTVDEIEANAFFYRQRLGM